MESSVENPTGGRLAALSLTALGVVFGDIATSPLYALRQCFHSEYGIAASPANVFGVLSLIFWALLLIVTIKYLLFILRADNDGEGGRAGRWRRWSSPRTWSGDRPAGCWWPWGCLRAVCCMATA